MLLAQTFTMPPAELSGYLSALWVYLLFALLPGAFLWFLGVKMPNRGRAWGLGILVGWLLWMATMSWSSTSAFPPVVVVISGALMVAAAIWLTLRTENPFAVASGLMCGYSFGWTLACVPSDNSGMSGVGLALLVMGVGFSLMVVALITFGIQQNRRSKQLRR